MTNPRQSEADPQLPHERIAAEDVGVRWLEEVLRGAHDQLEEDVRAWITDLTAADTALGHELGPQKNRQMSEAWERLERMEKALRQAPGQIAERLSQRIAEFASANGAQQQRSHRHGAHRHGWSLAAGQ